MHLEPSFPASHQLATLSALVHLDTPEKRARQQIDAALIEAGWHIQSRDAVNLNAGRGVAVREFRLKPGHGYADYLLPAWLLADIRPSPLPRLSRLMSAAQREWERRLRLRRARPRGSRQVKSR